MVRQARKPRTLARSPKRDPVRDAVKEPAAVVPAAPPDRGRVDRVDDSQRVSGHVAPPLSGRSIVDAPEHDWGIAARIVLPGLRPIGTQGVHADRLDRDALLAHASKSHPQPLLDEGPLGLAIVYALPASGFDVIVNTDHLLSWGVSPEELRITALKNLAAWSAEAAWTDEVSGDRRLLSSDTGDGSDAARVLLPEVREHLAAELGATGRVLVGLPERHLLIAGTLRPGDEEFAALIGDFVVEHSGGADEPIDRRVFELVNGELVPFAAERRR
ncbi:MAG: hypothetical protein AUG49_25705 [Catenulispora sp. 13_1_20CM_3_70_7]|nr:MAG: hypothetical protein AUG49_25705 [Catenulispora sp. 13_1_20CM_3_70_7]